MEEEIEIWRDILDYEGLYQISNLGNIKSLIFKTKVREKILIPFYVGKGYLAITLCKNKIKNKFLVHRLVAFQFIENPDNKPDVNHKKGIKNDNRACQLEWCTKSENSIHSFLNKLNIPPKSKKGIESPVSK